MKGINIFLLLTILLLLSPLSCRDNINHIEVNFANINKVIYDYYSSDNFTVNIDLTWILNYEGDNVLLFNSEPKNNFQKIEYLPETNYPIQCITAHEYNNQILTAPLILLNKNFHNLNNMTSADIIIHLINISQRLYINYLKKFNRELVDYPTLEYPLTNEQNLVLSTFEYNILLEAFQKSLDNTTFSKAEVLILLEQFYAIRVRRWRSAPAIVQSFELSQEKILGLSFYEAIKLVLDHEEKSKLHPQSPITDIGLPNVFDLLNLKMMSLYNDELIAFNSMSKPKAEIKGFLLAYLYDYLEWDYHPETTKDNFHAFLGTKLDLSATKIDSIYNNYLSRNNFETQKEMVTELKNKYLEEYEANITPHNLQISFDHYTDELNNSNEPHFVNADEKKILFPLTKRYLIKSNFLNIEIKNQGFLYQQNRREKNIMVNIPENTRLMIDNKAYRYDRLMTTLSSNGEQTYKIESLINPEFVPNIEFQNLSFETAILSVNTTTKGVLSVKDGVLVIKLAPTLDFKIEEEYIELITELNMKLVERGVPDGWLAENLNHEEFKIYHSVVRSFTNLPEHQVQRGERDQNWYMKNFGVDDKIRKGPAFKQANLKTLQDAERRFGIHYEIVMAIMAIETDYANPRWRGNFYTFPTLVTQYLLLPRRQRFSVNELVALYEFSQLTDNHPYHFIGSFAGAAGWGQFIPTSMNKFYVDSEDNPKDIDIFSVDDTIHSIANYLNKNGLNSGNMNNPKSRYNAVHAYNKSDAYVKAVLHIYDELRKLR